MSNAELKMNYSGKDAGIRAAAYAQALRHSARVRRLRILLPVSAVIISAIFISVSAIRSFLPENIKVESASVEDGQIVMEKPAVSGRNADGVYYSMTAARALQSIIHPNVLRLQDINAQVPVNDQLLAKVKAQEGIYDRDADSLDMTKPFTLVLSNGIVANFRTAKLNVKQGSLMSDDTVSITAPRASVVAQRLIIDDKGKDIVFDGGVQVDVQANVIHGEGR